MSKYEREFNKNEMNYSRALTSNNNFFLFSVIFDQDCLCCISLKVLNADLATNDEKYETER